MSKPIPMTQQPQGYQATAKWMDRPDAAIGCPPGLEYLTTLDQLLVHQKIELMEAMTGWETKNKYSVKNSMGQQCYYAFEESETCHRLCCGSDRGFVMHVVDNNNQEVLRAVREFKCCVGCCCCINGESCAYIINVESPVGVSIGRIIQLKSSWTPRYAVQNSNGEVMLRIVGPCCVCDGPCCTKDVSFNVFTADGKRQIGAIARQHAGFAQEMFTDATNFGVTFPADLDVKVKAMLLSATFLIDMMFFEYNED